jgi:hypothetical protein
MLKLLFTAGAISRRYVWVSVRGNCAGCSKATDYTYVLPPYRQNRCCFFSRQGGKTLFCASGVLTTRLQIEKKYRKPCVPSGFSQTVDKLKKEILYETLPAHRVLRAGRQAGFRRKLFLNSMFKFAQTPLKHKL